MSPREKACERPHRSMPICAGQVVAESPSKANVHRSGTFLANASAPVPAASRNRRPNCVFDDHVKPRAALPLRGGLAAGLSTRRTLGALELGGSSTFDWSSTVDRRRRTRGEDGMSSPEKAHERPHRSMPIRAGKVIAESSSSGLRPIFF